MELGATTMQKNENIPQRTTIEAVVTQHISRSFGIEVGEVDLAMPFKEFCCDLMDYVNMVVDLELHFGVQVQDVVATVIYHEGGCGEDIVELIEQLLATGSSDLNL